MGLPARDYRDIARNAETPLKFTNATLHDGQCDPVVSKLTTSTLLSPAPLGCLLTLLWIFFPTHALPLVSLTWLLFAAGWRGAVLHAGVLHSSVPPSPARSAHHTAAPMLTSSLSQPVHSAGIIRAEQFSFPLVAVWTRKASGRLIFFVTYREERENA